MANSKIGLIGRKLGMTQIFDAAGNAWGVTVIELGPNIVLQSKTKAGADGYSAVQLGYGKKRLKSANLPEVGHAKAAETEPAAFIREIRLSDAEAQAWPKGMSLNAADVFKANDLVDVQGTSKGKGFAGVMKRHNFKGFKATHGVHEYYRHGGSIGTRLTPGMTFKGMKMPGHMGNANVSVQNMRIVRVDAEKNHVFIRGGVPGPDGGFVVVRQAAKA